jgi:phosphatidylinositol 4-kinase
MDRIRSQDIAFPVVLLTAFHAILSRCPLPPISATLLPPILEHLIAMSTPSILVKLVHHSFQHSSPSYNSRLDPFTAAHPTTPGGVVMLITESVNILLASSLLPTVRPKRPPFTHSFDQATGLEDETLQARHVGLLVNEALSSKAHARLHASSDGAKVLQAASAMALRSWGECMGGTGGVEESSRRDSLFTLGGGIQDEEIELGVAILVSWLCFLSLVIKLI